MNILIVKLSSLGDVVHAMPALQDIRRALPQARIDWVVERGLAPLVRRCEGVSRVIECDFRLWRRSPLTGQTRQAWRLFKADLQQQPYDAVLDLQGLTKSALVARLARLSPGGKRYALANQTEGSGYEAPTRWVADVAIRIAAHTAAVQRSRELAAKALGYTLQSGPDYGLRVSLAQAAPETVADRTRLKMIAFIHGTSRADKEWPLGHWMELGQRFNAAGYQIVLPHGNASELATSQAIAGALNERESANAVVWPLLPLDALTQELAQCAGVIGVDSGVSHIAVALDLPHVQIYNFDTAWRTGPETAGRQVSVFAQPTPGVEAVWQAWLACRAVHCRATA
ncbi:MAG: lipopolysaccharide heptosyltransferase I [Burkholderiales bacterium RIFCSPHIGHO2_12_FULL_61_11]|nr:MAG: lipopolysaccharide heptosyltransferase I [Burkholderiales bacterium RIFCSPHIGHO2_12_FULL_61_11]